MHTLKKQLDVRVSKALKREGKKSQVKAGDMREVWGIIADEFYRAPLRESKFLYRLGRHRAKGKK